MAFAIVVAQIRDILDDRVTRIICVGVDDFSSVV